MKHILTRLTLAAVLGVGIMLTIFSSTWGCVIEASVTFAAQTTGVLATMFGAFGLGLTFGSTFANEEGETTDTGVSV